MTQCSQDSCDCVTCVCCSRRWKTSEQQLQKKSHRSAERCFLLRSRHHTLLIAFSSLYLFYVSVFFILNGAFAGLFHCMSDDHLCCLHCHGGRVTHEEVRRGTGQDTLEKVI